MKSFFNFQVIQCTTGQNSTICRISVKYRSWCSFGWVFVHVICSQLSQSKVTVQKVIFVQNINYTNRSTELA